MWTDRAIVLAVCATFIYVGSMSFFFARQTSEPSTSSASATAVECTFVLNETVVRALLPPPPVRTASPPLVIEGLDRVLERLDACAKTAAQLGECNARVCPSCPEPAACPPPPPPPTCAPAASAASTSDAMESTAPPASCPPPPTPSPLQCNLSNLAHPLHVARVNDQDAPFYIFSHDPRSDIHVSASLYRGTPAFESWLRPQFKVALGSEPGRLVLDIGANIGLHALYLAQLGHRVHAFEPFPQHYALLQCSVDMNFGARTPETMPITLSPVALAGADRDDMCIQTEDANLGHAYIVPCHDPDSRHKHVPVAIRTLDAYWRTALRGERVDVMKIDVEGFEPLVFEGAKEMMASAPPRFIFMEVFPDMITQAGRDTAEFLGKLVDDVGYAPFDSRTGGAIEDVRKWATSIPIGDLRLELKQKQ